MVARYALARTARHRTARHRTARHPARTQMRESTPRPAPRPTPCPTPCLERTSILFLLRGGPLRCLAIARCRRCRSSPLKGSRSKRIGMSLWFFVGTLNPVPAPPLRTVPPGGLCSEPLRSAPVGPGRPRSAPVGPGRRLADPSLPFRRQKLRETNVSGMSSKQAGGSTLNMF